MDELERAIAGAIRPPETIGRVFRAGTVASIPAAKGAYLLLIRLDRVVAVRRGGLAPATLDPGRYVYAGSANGPGGLRARLGRHLRADGKPHWHVDQLTAAAADMTALAVPAGDECALVDTLLGAPGFAIALTGFGSTDCARCASHLLRYSGGRSRMTGCGNRRPARPCE